jgi:hypothetical protein
MTTYTNPFTGQTISPSSVSYESISISVNTALQWPINGNTSTPASSIIDVTATTTGLQLQLPPASQVSTGQSVLVRNVGSNAFTVTDTSGNTIISTASGIAEFIFLTDNTTLNGVWSSVVFGAGTSSANASALAGYGLTPINTTLNQSYPTSTLYSNATLDTTSRAQFLVWGSGVGTITLPSASVVGNNWFVNIRNGGTGILTLTPSGTDLIDGNASQQLQLTESLVLVSNGSGYNTFAYGRSNSFAFTQLLLTVTGGTLTLTSAQGANILQEYVGTLASNQIIVLPSTVQLYTLTNGTSGAFLLTFKTSAVGAATITVGAGATVVAVCDGTNVFNANSSTGGTFTNLTLVAGSAGTPPLNFVSNATTGLYLPATAQIGFTVNGVNAATLASSGFAIPVGISGGTF